ncbi:calcium homeostasis endoplasmic reticulum protein isoform X2 [Girardinichthys multiradiatus]|uniref:calcium homeostasis endoplasmic reticulum protein isoform X2 n=1 Tax=Girardinichthys multiradiatus TaxID=208333 RepID=UPI001FAC7D28|nr:calcium homeostasis endoplasmic reticulum protein isoform X2 [Girardinichthys multiradiatus]
MDVPNPPEDQELRNVIDKLAQFVARNGPEFEKMTMEKQKDNPKFSFLFGGEYFSYYKCKLAMEQQQHIYNPGNKDVVDIPPPSMQLVPPPPIPLSAAPSIDELIQQSQWNLQQQEQHLHTLRQEQVTAAIALAMEQQIQKLLLETQLDITELDNLLQPIIDTCTKDAISAGKNWMFNNAKSPQHCELMASHLCNRITVDSAHFELRLHLIYLTNDVLHHCQRKQQKDLLAALQKVVVPIYCTSFLAVEEEKQQKITRLLQLWEKNGYFDEDTIQQLQNPALGLGQYQASLITEYAAVVQPMQLAFQQQIQALKTQHEKFVASLKQQQQAGPVRPAAAPAEAEKTPSMTTQAGDVKPPVIGPPSVDFDGAAPRSQDPKNSSGPSDIPTNKPAWFEPQHVGPWNPNQPPPFDLNQPPPPCPPWNSHEGMWNEQRDPGNWSGGPPRDGGPWSGPGGSEPGPPSWNSFDQQPPWGSQTEQPPWGQREPPFPPRMQRPPHFRGPFTPHQQPPPFNQPPPPPHNFGRFPPRFVQEEFTPRHHYDRPPYTSHSFDYPQGEYPGDISGPPLHHHPNQRIPPPAIQADHPPWGTGQHPDFGPPQHGFNGHSPHMRHRQHPVQDDPSLVPNVPYFDLPAGLMAPLVKLEDYDYKPLDPKDIRLPPPMPPSDRLLAAVEAFYSPPSHDRPRNSEGWEQNGLYEFFRAKMRARRKKEQEKRNSHGGSRSRSRSRSRRRSSSRSSSHSSKSSRSQSNSSHSRSRSRSYSRSRSRSRSRSSRSRSGSRSRSHSNSPTKPRRGPKSRSSSPSSTAVLGSSSSKLSADTRLGEENKGHQLLLKMGWSGSGGLGAKEQGIQDPIKGGDIRDKWDQYKGVGVSLDDPYENYRRNKSYNFVARMKAREEVNREAQESPSTD